MEKAVALAERENGDLVCFSELFVTGYPARDLLEKDDFIKAAEKANEEVLKISQKHAKIGIIFGNISRNPQKIGSPLYPVRKSGLSNGVYNSAIFAKGGKIVFTQHKSCLPRIDVFDEPRYFEPAKEVKIFPYKGEKLGISVCADIWAGTEWGGEYSVFPISDLARQGATLFINLSASPFFAGKEKIRLEILKTQAQKYKTPIIYLNQVGGNDELIFDGRSMIINERGELAEIFSSFKEEVKTVDTSKLGKPIKYFPEEEITTIHNGLILGLKDYLRKCGFKKAIIGISGGIDSSVTAALAVRALGKKNVLGINMPSIFSSREGIADAKKLAKNLGMKFNALPINSIYQTYLKTLKNYLGSPPHQKFWCGGKEMNAAKENIQARIRGNILMAFSNKTGGLVLSTGDKSELAVGYCTLYGDMAGGLAVISDLPKYRVYQLAEYVNREKEIIPKRILEKPPSPELRPGQLTEKDLIPYKILDPIVEFYIEERLSAEEIVKKGFDPKIVKWALQRIAQNEYKRRQAPPGLKVTSKAFGTGRRMPIAAVV